MGTSSVKQFAFALLVTSIAVSQAKVCFEACKGGTLDGLNHVDVVGCRRRSAYSDGRVGFACYGQRGPPCTVLRGDTVHLNVTFNVGHPITELTQAVHWMTGLVPVPWYGLDTDGCKYVEGKCKTDVTNRVRFWMPIEILEAYPPGRYPLRWNFEATDPITNRRVQLGCVRFEIRIL